MADYSFEAFQADMTLLGLPADGRRPRKESVTKSYTARVQAVRNPDPAIDSGKDIQPYSDARDRVMAWLADGAPPWAEPPKGPTPEPEPPPSPDQARIDAILAAEAAAWQAGLDAQKLREARRGEPAQYLRQRRVARQWGRRVWYALLIGWQRLWAWVARRGLFVKTMLVLLVLVAAWWTESTIRAAIAHHWR